MEEARFIIDLKENQGKTWTYEPIMSSDDNREIGELVPDRSAATMKVSYNRLKAMVEIFTMKDVIDIVG